MIASRAHNPKGIDELLLVLGSEACSVDDQGGDCVGGRLLGVGS